MSYKNLEMSLVSNWVSRDRNNKAFEGELGIVPSTELISILNALRIDADNEDIISVNGESNVWYSFCLHFDFISNVAELLGFVKGSKKDDFGIYNLPLKMEEKNELLKKVDAFLNDSEREMGVVA